MADKELAAADTVTPEQVAALAQRITAIETLLSQKIPGFEAVGGRVAELSTAFQQANRRLSTLESAVQALQEAPAVDVTALTAAVEALAGRVSAVETLRLRGGRLSRRLAEIEARLPDAPEGGSGE